MPEKPRRTRSQQAKPGPTQKSIRDIFGTKSVSKPQSVPNQDPPQNTRPAQVVELLDLSGDIDDNIDVTTPIRHELPQEVYGVVSSSGPPDPVHRRSPSIVIVEDSSEPSVSNTALPAVRQPAQVSSGRSPEEPIVIWSSPIKTPSFPHAKPDKPTHPFFTLHRAKTTTAKSTSKGVGAKPVVYEVPYPDAELQHVKGFQSPVHRCASPLPPRTSQRATETPIAPLSCPSDYQFLKVDTLAQQYRSRLANVERLVDGHENQLPSVPSEHRLNHPAISRLLDYIPGETHASRRPWSEKWRPTCAQEVLGNERNAIYLRNWLKALELQLENSAPLDANPSGAELPTLKPKATKRALKRPRVIRAVEKPRARKRSRFGSDSEDDGWIVHTQDDYEDSYQDASDAFSDDILPSERASSPPSSSDVDELPSSNTPIDALGQLHNTILLTGPSGSGKTAAIYACAEELGWDVFEVYPGVGRRNGASVDNLIGEVGKNHLVHQTQRPSEDALKSFLRQRSQKEAEEEEQAAMGAIYSPRKTQTRDPVATIDEPKLPRQSLILLEEVDILFKEDVNFWSTVTRIIRECKRPVICTCNDISLVPTKELPLQSILEFKACPSEVATSYLQSICRAEGYSIGRDSAMQVYCGQSVQEEGLAYTTSSVNKDLRRAIYGLQVTCTASDDGDSRSREQSQGEGPRGINEPEASKSQETGRRLSTRGSEFLSFLDSELVLDDTQSLVIKELAGYWPCSDDEIGHAILHDVHAKNSAQIGLHDRQEEMARSAIQVSRGLFDVDVKQDEVEWEVKRTEIRSSVRASLQEACPLEVWWSERGWHFSEYGPYLLQMISGEDEQERVSMLKLLEGGVNVGRNTRNSLRRGYERSVVLSVESRKHLVNSCCLHD